MIEHVVSKYFTFQYQTLTSINPAKLIEMTMPIVIHQLGHKHARSSHNENNNSSSNRIILEWKWYDMICIIHAYLLYLAITQFVCIRNVKALPANLMWHTLLKPIRNCQNNNNHNTNGVINSNVFHVQWRV